MVDQTPRVSVFTVFITIILDSSRACAAAKNHPIFPVVDYIAQNQLIQDIRLAKEVANISRVLTEYCTTSFKVKDSPFFVSNLCYK